jgi:exodeoxyribonuclease V alpha subunit
MAAHRNTGSRLEMRGAHGGETLRGQVEAIRIVREGWGFLTLLHGSATERATVTGHPLGVEVGDTIEVHGTWSTHPRWGRQFKAREIVTVEPSSALGVIEWMRSRLPNIGRKLATAIVERFGVEGTWAVLERDHQRLVELAGITEERARAIHVAYIAHLGERDKMVALKKWGLSDRQISRVIEVWGESALAEMRRDPYQLAEHVDGFGFVRADDVALRMGLPRDHESRVRAWILFALDEAAGAGHVYVPGAKLVAMGARTLGVSEDLVRAQAYALIDGGKAVRRSGAVYRPELAEAEEGVAASVRRLLARAVRVEGAQGSEARKGDEAA